MRFPAQKVQEDAARQRLPVFSDPGHRRRGMIRWLAAVVAVALVAWSLSFGARLYYVEKLPESQALFGAADMTRVPEPLFRDPEAPALPSAMTAAESPAAGAPAVCAPGGGAVLPVDLEVLAYLPAWPDWTYASLLNNCDRIDVVMPQWYAVPSLERGLVSLEAGAEHQQLIREMLAAPSARQLVYPVVEMAGTIWQDPAPARLPVGPLAETLAAEADRQGVDGLCLKIASLPPSRLPDLSLLVRRLSDLFAGSDRGVCVIVGPGSPVPGDSGIVARLDRLVVLGFEEPWIGDAPGPLAPQPAFAQTAAAALDAVGPAKLTVGVGNFAYEWSAAGGPPERIAFAEAMRRAERHGGQVSFPPDVLNTRIGFTDDAGVRREIWALDAVSGYNQIRALAETGVTSVAVWALGLEDPGLWSVIDAQTLSPAEAAGRLATVTLENYVGYEGDGPLRRLGTRAASGARWLTPDADAARLTGQTYARLPRPITIERFGAAAPGDVVITFDDGPDNRYTPQILDILAEKDATATFFVVGRNVLGAPEVARRIVADGHEIGSHTFFHPQLDAVPGLRVALELNTLQRLIGSVTGRHTVLFRTPYGRAEGPLTGDQARPLALIDEAGYVVAGSEIVPPDWRALPPEEIVAHIRDRLDRDEGNLIVLHDAGGDRSATVAALPVLIDTLRADGYRIVSLAALLGVERAELMPPADDPWIALDAASFQAFSTLGGAMQTVFWIVVLAGGARGLVLLVLAHLPRGRRRGAADPPVAAGAERVTVVIPAYNEEAVIVDCVGAVLASDEAPAKVLVIDDGSVDHTFERVKSAYGADSRVEILRETNQGKWAALDAAYGHVDTDIVVAIDADTFIAPDAIARLLPAFEDPAVGAVAGNVRVGNARNLLTRLESLEYVTAQNVDRRAAEIYNGIMVVPGAIGAWRAEAVRKAGLYTCETVAEDADLTVSVLRAGYRVRFEPLADATTDVPARPGAFLRQRLRWTFGMMQTAWKHRRALAEGRGVGIVSIPDLFLFGILVPMMAPIADLVFLATLIDLGVNAMLDRPETMAPASLWIIAGYLTLPALDLLKAVAAFRLDRRADWRLLLLLPFQRLVYAPLLYITVFRAVIRAITGRLIAWGQARQTGTAALERA